MTIPGCWPTAGSSPTRTPAPARSCCAGRSPAEACPRSSIAIMAPFSNAWLARTCAVLGIRLVHSQPYSPEGRGKQERLNRYIRERFVAEAEHAGIEDLAELNDRFEAWTEQVANRRTHAETNQTPIERFEAGGPPRAADPSRLREAFLWVATRRVTKTATVSLEANQYSV